MASDDMVERVARAVALADGQPVWDFEAFGTEYRSMAVAAIKAARELTDDEADTGQANNFGRPARAAWEAICDAALARHGTAGQIVRDKEGM